MTPAGGEPWPASVRQNAARHARKIAPLLAFEREESHRTRDECMRHFNGVRPTCPAMSLAAARASVESMLAMSSFAIDDSALGRRPTLISARVPILRKRIERATNSRDKSTPEPPPGTGKVPQTMRSWNWKRRADYLAAENAPRVLA